MDKKTIFNKTAKGEHEAANLSSDLKRILSLIDGKSKADDLAKRAPPSLRQSWNELLGELLAGGYIVDQNQPHLEAKIAKPKFNPLKMFVPKPAAKFESGDADMPPTDDLDFSNMNTSSPASAALDEKRKSEAAASARADLEARKKAEADAARAELEASVAAAKAKANAEAAAKAQAKAKLEAEIAARVKAEAEIKAKQEALLRNQAEEKTKHEAALRLQAQHEAARAKAAQEVAARAKAAAEARVRADIEAAARAQQEAEAKAKLAAEAARLKIEQEALRVKVELEAAEKAKANAEAARLKAEAEAVRAKAELEAAKARAEAEAKALAEARIRQEAEEKARQEAETARLKAEQEAARVKAELEAAKARAEAEAKALAEARIRQEAEEKSRREAEAARIKAEQEAARIKAEQEAARIKAEQEAARVKAEQEAARVKAEQEARVKVELEAAKVRAEAEARALAEARIRQEAEEKSRREAEAARVKVEQEIVARARAEAEARAAAEVLARTKQAELAAKQEAEESARRAAALSKSETTQPDESFAPVSVSTPAFEINLDNFKSGLEPVHQTATLTAQAESLTDVDAVARSRVEAEEKAEAEKISLKNVAAEMARLKEEAEEARRKAEANARRLAEEHALAEEQARTWAEAEQRAKAQAILELEQSAQQVALSQAKATKTRSDRKRSNPLPWGKIILSMVALVLIVAVALPYVYPLNEYIAPLEQRLSAQLKQPVHIGGLTAASIPPKLRLQNVTVGSGQEVKIGSAVLEFDLSSLFSAVKVIGNAELDDVSIEGRLLDKQAASLKLLGSNKNYPVRHLDLRNLKIVSDEVALPVFSGIADIDAQGAFSRISLHSADDKLGVDIQSDQGRWQLGVNLKESSLPLMRNIVFSDLSAKGELSDGGVNFTEMDAHVYNGILLGTAKLNWTKGWQLQGTVEAKTFDLDQMFPKLHLEGDVYGEATFSMAGTKLSQLYDDPHLDGTFNVKKGTFNVDMVETARLLSRDNLVGGRTHFDDMIGQVKLDSQAVHFRQLKIVSGMLNASGSFDVSSNNQLSGNFNAEIKMRDGNNPLVLYGTLPEEKLRAGH